MEIADQRSLFDTQQRSSLTLSQLTGHVGDSIRRNLSTQNVWVTAELSDLHPSGGHCYMELVEKNEAGVTIAKLRAAIWASNFFTLRRKFAAVTGRDLSSGLKVMVYGSVNHHPVYGISFIISDIDPSYTLGDIQRLRREILQRLTKEGIVELNKSQSLPRVPQRIAVISAAGAAGYGDFMRQLETNSDGFVFYPFLFPAVLQGEKTSPSVREALAKIEMTIDLWDCVAILRGGGSTSDLISFDDYELAKSVATFPLPVIVGIGHERDRTVLDEIAHTRVKTPTAAAAFFIDMARESYSSLTENINFISRYVADRVAGEKRNLTNLQATITSMLPAQIKAAGDRLGKIAALFPAILSGRITEYNLKLQNTISNIPALLSFRLKTETNRLDSLAAFVKAMSPAETLRRGYSITRVNGKALRSTDEISINDTIVTTLYDGSVISTITEKKQNGK